MSWCPMRPQRLDFEPECRYFRADGEPPKPWEIETVTFTGSVENGTHKRHVEPVNGRCTTTGGIATCTYWGSSGIYAHSCVGSLTCVECTHWRPDDLAHPESEKPGSLRVCAIGRTSHAGSWCKRWSPLTDAQVIEAANDEGRLF